MLVRFLAVLAVSLIAAAGCARKSGPVPASGPATPALSAWPAGRTAPLTITDALVLRIPLQYQRSAIEDPRAPHSPFSGAGRRSEARFDFFLPGFSGYTLQNYRNEFDDHKVEVVYLHAGDSHEADPGAPGEYPPNMLKRLLQDFLDPKAYQDTYGLRCYRGRVVSDRLTCYGLRDAANREDILLYVPVTPAGSPNTYPMIKANYFSARYGGVRIAWRTHVSNLPRWQEIDAQIWKFIDAWNVRQPAAEAAGTAAAQPPGVERPK